MAELINAGIKYKLSWHLYTTQFYYLKGHSTCVLILCQELEDSFVFQCTKGVNEKCLMEDKYAGCMNGTVFR